MRIAFRTDAWIERGTGHVARCATLARVLREAGHETRFLCREAPGDLNAWLESEGFAVTRLALPTNVSPSQQDDAGATRAALAGSAWDWLVVDQYELDAAWEKELARSVPRIFAIDDLGRPHRCDVLLDQNYANPTHDLYRRRVNADCHLLLGPRFALVRPEFAALREKSLQRARRDIARVLVFMGGSDATNETAKALAGLMLVRGRSLTADVVIGHSNPNRGAVEALCAQSAALRLHIQTPRMATLMAEADLVVGAGGTTTWERCALGVPALVTILAANQETIAQAVASAGAQQLLGWHDRLEPRDYAEAITALEPAAVARMSASAAALCDGRGTQRIVDLLTAPDASPTLQASVAHA